MIVAFAAKSSFQDLYTHQAKGEGNVSYDFTKSCGELTIQVNTCVPDWGISAERVVPRVWRVDLARQSRDVGATSGPDDGTWNFTTQLV